MTRPTNARLAGMTFLVYIAAGVSGMAIAAGPLLSVVLSLVMCFSAFVLGVTLYALTRDLDPELALLAMICRIGEGVLGAAPMPVALAMRSLGQQAAGGSDAPAFHVLTLLMGRARGFNVALGATFFAIGSLLFCWLLLRGRMIPGALARVGVFASAILVVALPFQLAGALTGVATQLMWIPMAAFEIPLAVWLIARGVKQPTPR